MLSTCLLRTRTSRTLHQLLRWGFCLGVCAALGGAALAATFGAVAVIGGQPADLALDEGRGVVYVANYTANRIDVVSMQTKKVVTSMNVAPQPASLALSPDGRFLVIVHLSNFQAPDTPYNGLTIMDLNANTKRTMTLGAPPLGVAFGNDGLALVATTLDFLLLDPATGYLVNIGPTSGVTAKPLPVDTPTSPREVIRASMTASGDGSVIWGILEVNSSQTLALLFKYTVYPRQIDGTVWTATPPLGPRVVSTNQTGTKAMFGWALYDSGFGAYSIAAFPDASGDFGVGGYAIDTVRNVVYSQVPTSTWTKTTPAVLTVADADNLAPVDQLSLRENLTGRAVLDSQGQVLYAVSASGVSILPVGSLAQLPRVKSVQEDVVFRGNWCDRKAVTQQINVVDPGGNATPFVVSADTPGVSVSPSSGTTPATVTVSLDMNQFQNTKGTLTGNVIITSPAAVNIPKTVRLLINNHEPDQRGTFIDVPGTLVDILADQQRNRLYVLRQDTYQLLVFDATNYKQIATLKTGSVPWSMAMTFDGKYLVTGADYSQVAQIFRLDTMTPAGYVAMPSGHYPRWLAASGNGMLAASRVAGPAHTIDKLQIFGAGSYGTQLPSLGIWKNSIDINTALVGSPSGSMVLAAEANGTVLLYDANADTFVSARQDTTALSGAIAAVSDDTFVVGNSVLNGSLVTVGNLDDGTGLTSGFAVADSLGLRTTAVGPTSPGTIERVDLTQGGMTVRPTRTIEAPVLANISTATKADVCTPVGGVQVCVPGGTSTVIVGSAFTRTLAPLPNQGVIASLSTSGITVLPWQYDAAVADPQINSIASAADGSASVAPGGLFTIAGTALSPVNIATNEVPLPTLLGESCMTINGVLVPMILASPTQVNGQIPFSVSGTGTMILRTPGGVSNSFKFDIAGTAPSVFQATIDGWDAKLPTVVRATNGEVVTPSNPIHDDDWVVIYATGLGVTSPDVNSGAGGPTNPLATAISQPEVTLGGTDLAVAFAGLAPGQVGVYQINAKVPFKGVPTGMSIPLTIKQGDTQTTISVRVVH